MSRFSVASVVALVAVVAVTAIAAVQLARTVRAATQINDKAASIADSGRGINLATDSVVQLRRTNDTAGSILRSAQPLEEQLAAVVDEAQGIDAVARSINGNAARIDATAADIDATAGDINAHAGDINSTAGDIDSTAAGIDAETTGILDVAGRIDVDARLINRFLDRSIAIVRRIKGDTGDILEQAIAAHDTAACIDRKLGGTRGNDGHCEGRDGSSDEGGEPPILPPPLGGSGAGRRSEEEPRRPLREPLGPDPLTEPRGGERGTPAPGPDQPDPAQAR